MLQANKYIYIYIKIRTFQYISKYEKNEEKWITKETYSEDIFSYNLS